MSSGKGHRGVFEMRKCCGRGLTCAYLPASSGAEGLVGLSCGDAFQGDDRCLVGVWLAVHGAPDEAQPSCSEATWVGQ